MTVSHTLAIAADEWRTQWRSPLIWLLVALACLTSMSVNPTAFIPRGGDADAVPAVNSVFALAHLFGLSGFLVYTFFASIMAGMAVIRDEEARVLPLLSSTPLTPASYILGKIAGVLAVLLGAVVLHLLFVVLTTEVWPGAAGPRLPFRPMAYLVPVFGIMWPGVVFSAGVAFAVGERFRSPMAVYAVPVVLFIGVLFFLWTWAPDGLPAQVDRLLAIVDPSGLRWMNVTMFGTDRGVAYYNTASLSFDTTLVLNRVLVLAIPLIGVAMAIPHFARSQRHVDRATKKVVSRHEAIPSRLTGVGEHPGSGLPAMRQQRPAFTESLRTLLRAEMRWLYRQPALLLFVPFIMAMIGEFASSGSEVLGAPVVHTAGTMATGSIEVVTVLMAFLLLFYGVESVQREATTRFRALLYASPAPTAAILLAKGLANGLLLVVILGAGLVACLITLAGPSGSGVSIMPFLLVWVAILGPTFYMWFTLVMAVMSATGSRYATYAVGLSMLAATVYLLATGTMTWRVNWSLWGTLRWTDMGIFPLNGPALLANRILVVVCGCVFALVAVGSFRRRTPDTYASRHLIRILARHRAMRAALALAFVALAISTYIAVQIDRGPQGVSAEDDARAYWRQNVATWSGVETPALRHATLHIDLAPADRRMEVQGLYTLRNETADTVARIPFTVGRSFEAVRWRVGRQPVTVEDRAGLHVLTLPSALAPGDSVRVAFSYRAMQPAGFTRNGGGMSQFILPAGVALSTLRGEFLPAPGFVEGIGIDENNRPDPAEVPDDFWRGRLAPIGNVRGYTTHVTVTAPSAYTVTSVGERTAEQTSEGRKTVVWESTHPVTTLVVLAGRWDVRQQEGNAVYYHPAHGRNVDDMLDAMTLARSRFSEWFYPYPWATLRINEVPALASVATGYPTNIRFSEDIGFLAAPDASGSMSFFVAAHEVAHQWWGTVLVPGEGPGADVLIESMANYAALLMVHEAFGATGRAAFGRRLEANYQANRRVDGERPLARIVDDGGAHSQSVLYDKGAWALWMLHDHLGADRMLAGLRVFFERYRVTDDYPAVDDLLATLREQATDLEAFDALVRQWFYGTGMPEYRVSEPLVVRDGAVWRVSATVENIGGGLAGVDVAIQGAPSQDAVPSEQRHHLELAPGQPRRLEWRCPFPPHRIVVDPDVRVLQIERENAEVVL